MKNKKDKKVEDIDLIVEEVSLDQTNGANEKKPVAEQEDEIDEGCKVKKEEADEKDPVTEAEDEEDMSEETETDSKKSEKKDEGEVTEEEEEEMKESTDVIVDNIIKTIIPESQDVSEDINALVEGDETLTEEFKKKAAVIFEAAVSSKVRERVEALKEEFNLKVEEKIEKMHEEISVSLDKYLTYVVEQWFDSNKIQAVNMLRVDIAENFISSLKSVFHEHYIEVPDSKVNMVDDLTLKLEEAKELIKKNNETVSSLNEELSIMKKDKIILESADGLAETQVIKLKSLIEDVEFVDEEQFKTKVDIIKNAYFTRNKLEEKIEDKNVTVKTVILEEQDNKLSPEMERYLKASKKLNKEAF